MKLDYETLAFIGKAVDAHYNSEAGRILLLKHSAEQAQAHRAQSGQEAEGWTAFVARCRAQIDELEQRKADVKTWLDGQGLLD